MTMVPSQSSKQNSEYVFYSNTTTSTAMNQVQVVEGLYNNNCFGSEFVLRHMADHEEEDYSSSSRRPNTDHHNEPEPEPEPVSTSRQEEQEGEGEGANNNNNNWLQLSIGFHQTAVTTTTKIDDRDHHHHAPSSGSGLLELELLPTNWASSRPNLEPPPAVAAGRGCSSNFGATNSLVFEQTTSFSSSSSYSSMSMSMPSGPTFGGQQQQQQQQILPHQWAFGPLLPLPHSMPTMPSSTSFITTTTSYSSSHSSSLRPPLGSYNYPHHHHHQYHAPFHFPPPSPSSSGFDQFDVAGPSSHVTVRVVDPPRRPHSGIWFMLQASQNQAKEPYLPQIPKNYLRIKDGRMTVRLLLKYLVSKLRLDSESEIEITCRGQQLLPFLTLQHVRDNIWTPRDHTTSTRALLSDSSTTDHVMVLHYGRSTS